MFSYSFCSSGISLTHGPHQLPQTFTTVSLLSLNTSLLISPPVTVFAVNSGNFTSSFFESAFLASSFFDSPVFVSSAFVSFCFVSSVFVSSAFVSSAFVSSCFVSSAFVSFCFVSSVFVSSAFVSSCFDSVFVVALLPALHALTPAIIKAKPKTNIFFFIFTPYLCYICVISFI